MLLLTSLCARSQSGVNFEEFTKKLQPYFDDELIGDLKKEMPEGNYSIWGWAVGDYSGDGFYDAAFALRVYSDKGKVMRIYLFVDMDGYLVKVGEFLYKYQGMPLEVGVIIRDGACLLTRKNREYAWDITGYSYDNGALLNVDEYKIRRIRSLTYESYINFDTKLNKHNYIQTSSGKTRIDAKYLTIPCYDRRRYIYKGYNNRTFANDIDYVPAGAYYWNGPEDLSYNVVSSYDKDYLYFDVYVKDDKIITDNCADCVYESLGVLVDVNKYDENNTRLVKMKRNSIEPQKNQKKGLYYLKFSPGNFSDIKASVLDVTSSDEMSIYQKEKVADIRISAGQYDSNYYIVNIRIPILVLGLESIAFKERAFTELGCTFFVFDSDNPYNIDEVTELTTSRIKREDSRTYGSLLIVPDGMWYGEAVNIYHDKLINSIKKFGY